MASAFRRKYGTGIGKNDHRRLRVEQTSHQKMTMPGGETVIDIV
jgi:hypothetical protein